jgi:hypothetical protein
LPLLVIKIFHDLKLTSIPANRFWYDDRNDKWLLPLIYSFAALLVVITVIFFSGKQSDGQFGFRFLLRPMFSGNHALQTFKYSVYMACSVVLPALLIWRSFKLFPNVLSALKSYFWLCVIVLVLIPYVGYGMNNDFVLRASMPTLFAFRLCLLHSASLLFATQDSKALSKPYRQNRLAFQVMALCGVLALGDISYRNLKQWQNRPSFESVPTMVRLYEREEFKHYKAQLYAQYLGNLNKTLFS